MIDVTKEELFALDELRRRIPRAQKDALTRRDKDPPYQTVLGWAKVGRWNRSHTRRVKLETVKASSGLSTSLESYWRWLTELNK